MGSMDRSLNSSLSTINGQINSINTNKVKYFYKSFTASTQKDFLKQIIDYVVSNDTGLYCGSWSGHNYYVAFMNKVGNTAVIGGVAYGIGDSSFYTISRNGSTYVYKNAKGETI